MDVPVACRLGADAARSQVDEWRDYLSEAVADVTRPTPTVLGLRLRVEASADLPALVDLARREKACCGFFDFALRIEVDGVELTVEVPAEATELLDEFASLASRPIRR